MEREKYTKLRKVVYFGMTYGIAASGKSTLARFIKKTNKLPTLNVFLESEDYGAYHDFDIVSSDRIREKVYRRPLEYIFAKLDPEKEEQVWDQVEDRVIWNLMRRKKNTILDATSLFKKDRLYFLNTVNRLLHSFSTFLLVVNVSLETALRRNRERVASVPEDVIRKMYEVRKDRAEQPSLDEEKWDLIYYFNSDKVKLKA